MYHVPARAGPAMSSAPRHLAGLWLATLVLALALQLALAPAPFGRPPARPPAAVGVGGLARAHAAVGDYWAVYFSIPAPLRRDDAMPEGGGIDAMLAAAMDAAQVSLDVAAFELDNPRLSEAMLAAARRGLRVRAVTDDEHGLRAADGHFGRLQVAGIPVAADGRSALMHNKFVIIDGRSVWSGSMNLTLNGAARHNNNLLELRSAEAARRYQAEFDEMFEGGRFGPRSPRGETALFDAGTGRLAVYFGPEDDLAGALLAALAGARERIRFMAFSFTLDDLGAMLLQRAAAGVQVQGIFERVGSESVWSELGPLYCAGLEVRQDGNPYLLHHKVFIIDDDTVVTGSANFSAAGTESNDENMLVIEDAALAAAYAAEFARRRDESSTPVGVECG